MKTTLLLISLFSLPAFAANDLSGEYFCKNQFLSANVNITDSDSPILKIALQGTPKDGSPIEMTTSGTATKTTYTVDGSTSTYLELSNYQFLTDVVGASSPFRLDLPASYGTFPSQRQLGCLKL